MGGTNGRGLSLRRVSSPEAYAEYEQALACETVVPMLGRWGIAIGGAAILDAGCGMGGVTVALAARGARVLGLEIDSERVEAARRFAEKSGVSAQYVCADAAASSSLDGYRDFDGIVLRDVVEHVADSGGMLSRLRGSIRGSGWMFVSFPRTTLLTGGTSTIRSRGQSTSRGFRFFRAGCTSAGFPIFPSIGPRFARSIG